MSSRALGASASWRPRSTAVLLEARRRPPERPRRRLGHRAQFQMAWISRHDEHHPISVSSSKFEFNIRLMGSQLSSREIDDLPNSRLHNLNGRCGAQLLRFRTCQIVSKGRVQSDWIEMQLRNNSSRYGALAL